MARAPVMYFEDFRLFCEGKMREYLRAEYRIRPSGLRGAGGIVLADILAPWIYLSPLQRLKMLEERIAALEDELRDIPRPS